MYGPKVQKSIANMLRHIVPAVPRRTDNKMRENNEFMICTHSLESKVSINRECNWLKLCQDCKLAQPRLLAHIFRSDYVPCRFYRLVGEIYEERSLVNEHRKVLIIGLMPFPVPVPPTSL